MTIAIICDILSVRNHKRNFNRADNGNTDDDEDRRDDKEVEDSIEEGVGKISDDHADEHKTVDIDSDEGDSAIVEWTESEGFRHIDSDDTAYVNDCGVDFRHSDDDVDLNKGSVEGSAVSDDSEEKQTGRKGCR